MLGSLFKKSETELQHDVNLKQSEQALQARVNQMLRKTVQFDWTTAMHPTMTQPRANSDAFHDKK